MGLIPSKSGSITFEGKDITKVPGYKLVPMGIAHVPEGRRVFAQPLRSAEPENGRLYAK